MKTKTLEIPLLLPQAEDCERCAQRLRDSLAQVKGVEAVEVPSDQSTIMLRYNPDLLSLEVLERRALEIGVELAERIGCETLHLEGMCCPDDIPKIEKTLLRRPGVIWASANFASSGLHVEFEQAHTSLDDIIKALRSLGLEAHPTHVRTTALPFFRRHRPTLLAAASGLMLGIGGLLEAVFRLGPTVWGPCYLAALGFGGYELARGSLGALRARIVDINVLMGLAALGAMLLGTAFWDEGAMVAFLYSLGSALENYTMERTRRSIRGLMEAFPSQAAVRRNGREQMVPVEQIEVGEIVVVRPGDKIPCDGAVEVGSSTVNQAPVTGESLPVAKGRNDPVYAGTINELGALEIRVQRPFHDNTVARIIHLVEHAQAQKAPAQRFAERFGRIYTPMVIGLAALVAILLPLLGDRSLVQSLASALTLLVVSCPCAMVISTPVTVVAALSRAARNGVLIKGGAYLEAAGRLSAIAFDKTGTLTQGRPEVTSITPASGVTPEQVLSVAASVESYSEHPLASAILRAARKADLEAQTPEGFEALPGRGARGVIAGQTYLVGQVELWPAEARAPFGLAISELRQRGQTTIAVGTSEQIMGVIAIADAPKASARQAIEGLRKLGMGKLVMLTGDNPQTAGAVCADLGLDECRAGLLPEDKLTAVRALAAEYGGVAMVGDGVNDAPAMAAATVGIAMGTAGSDQALETADIALMSDDLTQLPFAIELSRKALGVIRQNLAFSVFTVSVLVITAVAGWLELWQGVLGHEVSALLVIANGMRLLRKGPE